MSAKIISGKEIAQQIREELKQEVEDLKAKHDVVPGLVTILVGENPASVSYVTAKQRTSLVDKALLYMMTSSISPVHSRSVFCELLPM